MYFVPAVVLVTGLAILVAAASLGAVIKQRSNGSQRSPAPWSQISLSDSEVQEMWSERGLEPVQLGKSTERMHSVEP